MREEVDGACHRVRNRRSDRIGGDTAHDVPHDCEKMRRGRLTTSVCSRCDRSFFCHRGKGKSTASVDGGPLRRFLSASAPAPVHRPKPIRAGSLGFDLHLSLPIALPIGAARSRVVQGRGLSSLDA